MRCAVFILAFSILVVGARAESGRHDATGADEVRYRITRTGSGWDLLLLGAGVDRPDQAVFVALGTKSAGGSSLVPAEKGQEGSAVWLPFPADLLLVANRRGNQEVNYLRRWSGTQWGPREPAGGAFTVSAEPAQVLLGVPDKLTGSPAALKMAVYLKDLAADNGWGRFYGALDATAGSGTGERVIRHYLSAETGKGGTLFRRAGRVAPDDPKVRIYQLLPRLFGNQNETRQPNGTLAENGSGKFSQINDTALGELKTMGFTHLWLTGVMQQATATDYAAIGEPADDPDLLKGMAGSPYAIRDYFDVSPDYADEPGQRLAEFKALVQRIHAQGMKVLVDFVPNHVARSYASTVKPELSFGANDDRTKFFDPKNNFYYLTSDSGAEGEGPPLRLPTVDGDGRATSPTVQAAGGGDGLFDGEAEFGRVTGNNVVSWSPGVDSWYETVKLNYGYDFTDPEKATRRYPHGAQRELPVPDTWKKMDEVIAYWQGLGVDGFRADMAHMVPPEFWRWLIARSRERNAQVYWMAEAYDDDDSKVPGGDPDVAAVTAGAVMPELLNAGFDAVYDDPSYDALKELYDGEGTANALDAVRGRAFYADNAVRYAENHDEVRLAAEEHWGEAGAAVGRPVSALLFGLSRGPVMIYHGQEVGEPGAGAEGFGREDGRTTIYDYWSMPEFVKWVNDGKFDGGRLGEDQRSLRDFYRRLLAAVDQPAFRDGDFYPLNPDNLKNPRYGRVRGASIGQWLYAYLRYDPASGQRMLVVVNLHPRETMEDVSVRLPRAAMRFLGWDAIAGSKLVPVVARDRLGEVPGEAAEIQSTPAQMQEGGLPINELQPLTAAYYELVSGTDAARRAP
ncbi:MAG: alpha-amylase family glycosyl hydrolase [Chthoniobacterales bacterium]